MGAAEVTPQEREVAMSLVEEIDQSLDESPPGKAPVDRRHHESVILAEGFSVNKKHADEMYDSMRATLEGMDRTRLGRPLIQKELTSMKSSAEDSVKLWKKLFASSEGSSGKDASRMKQTIERDMGTIEAVGRLLKDLKDIFPAK